MAEGGRGMPLTIVRQDITEMATEAIVNTANPDPLIGSGVDKAIHDKAGEKLLEERKKIGRLEVGEVAVTKGYGLKAKYVIHVSGPSWIDGEHDEKEMLYACYTRVLEEAKKLGIRSISFPLLSSGNYSFPQAAALETALNAINSFLLQNSMIVYLVVFRDEALLLSQNLYKDIEEFIDANYVAEKEKEEYGTNRARPRRISSSYGSVVSGFIPAIYPDQYRKEPTLEDYLRKQGETFQQRLFRLIDQRDLKDTEVYKKADITKQHFSKIRSNPDYRPSKGTVIDLCFALELDLDEANDLLARAGYSLSPSSKEDLVVKYYLLHKKYDRYELKEAFYDLGLPS